MADAAVSFAIENVGNLVIDESKFLWGVRNQVEEMHIELECMQCFLKDADRRKGESRRVQNWVFQIREAAYDIEDLVERFVLKTGKRNRKGVMNRIKKYAFFINHAVELHRVGSRIETIKAKLSTLRTRLQTYGISELREGGEEVAATGRRKRQDYAHVVVDHKVVGLEKKITELVEHLLDAKQESVICVHGMGGLGKTTTAKQVYSDKRIRENFECFAWVYISQQCNLSQVWESILSQLSDNRVDVGKIKNDNMPSQLCCIQKEKKCLIIVDDIWTSQDWNDLSAAFPSQNEENRSKILLTTRYEDVVSKGVYRSNLNILDDKTSLELLNNTILSLGGTDHPCKYTFLYVCGYPFSHHT